jgi:hypothetical protein
MNNLETYTQACGKLPFDWNGFLSKANYTNEDLIFADTKARSWVTCACGSQCNVLPRDGQGQPEDPLLKNLGLRFMYAIGAMFNAHNSDYDSAIQIEDFATARRDAKEILQQIEDRATDLILESCS